MAVYRKHVVGRAPMMRFNDLVKVARNRWMRAAHRSSFMKNRGGCLSLEVEVEMMLMIKTATLKTYPGRGGLYKHACNGHKIHQNSD